MTNDWHLNGTFTADGVIKWDFIPASNTITINSNTTFDPTNPANYQAVDFVTWWSDETARNEEGLVPVAGGEKRRPRHKPRTEGYRLRGWFQGVEFDVEIKTWEDSPIEAVMRAVLALAPGERVTAVLVEREDGTSDIRGIKNGRG